jgi:pSer/pThr/pTyr-binding forkhead associated (FHA) protein
MDVNLVLFKKDGSQKSFVLPSSLTVVGRRHDCDLCIPLMDVSRRHCELNQNSETLEVRDLGSRNGTFLNGRRVDGETAVNAGDYLQVGPLVFQLQIDGKPEAASPPQGNGETPGSEDELISDDDILDLDIDGSGSFLDELEEL